jgi:hypothetical protein
MVVYTGIKIKLMEISWGTDEEGGHAVTWLVEHYATSRKVVGSSNDELDFFQFM